MGRFRRTAAVFVILASTVTGSLARPLVAAAASAYATTVLADSPTAYWRLGETSGTTAADATGGSNAGTIQAGVALASPGAISDGDTAMTFNATAGYVSTPLIQGAWNNFSIEAWVMVNALPTTDYPLIMSTFGLGGNSGFELYLDKASDHIGLGIDTAVSGTQYRDISGAAVTTGIWYYVAASYDGANVRTYLNGNLTSAFGQTGALVASPWPMMIGRCSNNCATPPYIWNGRIDEPAIYSTSLSLARILAHYNAGRATLATETISGTLSISPPAPINLGGAVAAGSTVSNFALGTLSWTDNLSDATTSSVTFSSTDLYNSPTKLILFTRFTVTAGSISAAGGNSGSAPTPGAGGTLSGGDGSPGSTQSSTVPLASASTTTEGIWTQPNTITVVVPATLINSGPMTATIVYTVAG